MVPEYANCPFCGSRNVGPSYWDCKHGDRIFKCTAIGCSDCAAHGPVRNDYPLLIDTTANKEKADKIEEWTRAAWNRLPAIAGKEASKLDARIYA